MNKKTNKQTNKQTNKKTKKQTNKQTNISVVFSYFALFWGYISFRLLVKLQAEQLRVHAHEISKLWQHLDQKHETHSKLETVSLT